MKRSLHTILLTALLFPALAVAKPARADDAGRSRSVPTSFSADGSFLDVDLGGRARALAHPGASGSVREPAWVPAEAGGKLVRAAVVLVREGELTLRLPADGSAPAIVKAPGGESALVWRGSAHVLVRGGSMRVAIDEGAAYAGGDRGWLHLAAGSAIAIERGAAPRWYRGRLAAPPVSACPEGVLRFVASTAPKAPARVCWEHAEGAQGYRIEIAKDAAMKETVALFDATSDRSSAETELPPGGYHARVAALGPDGIPSLPSASLPFRLVRAGFPAGAAAARDGTIVLSPGQAVRLADSADPADSGLVVASAAADDLATARVRADRKTAFSPLPAAVTLQGHGARVVRVRDASGAEGRLALVARTLRAHVLMSPRRPHWPEDPIDVSVIVEDPHGRIDPTSEKVELEVLINGRPVATPWARRDNVYHAYIPPADGPGPWFVRVVARDGSGHELGGYVVDVDGRQPLASSARAE